MSQSIPAIFDSGVFKPLVPVDLAEGTRVEVGLPAQQDQGHDSARWKKFLDDMEALPDDSPDDGFSNRDHDRLIYGE
jgi:predicted DNA-binding antitoxin AbrB/MazE fold protein